MINFDEYHALKQRERQKESSDLSKSSNSIDLNQTDFTSSNKPISTVGSNVKSNKVSKNKKKSVLDDPSIDRMTKSNTDIRENKPSLKSENTIENKKTKSFMHEKTSNSNVLLDSVAYSHQSLGVFIESYIIQILCILVIILDTHISFMKVYFDSTILKSKVLLWRTAEGQEFYLSDTTKNILSDAFLSYNKFAMVYYLIEMIVIYLSFGTHVIGHLGYLLDSIVLSIQLLSENYGFGPIIRVLNILRLWRIIRVCNMLISNERDIVESYLKKIEVMDTEKKKVELEVRRLNGELERDRESRKTLEEMIQAYKDEVDTLNEALRIAAMDIAEVAEVNEMDGEYEEDLEEQDEEYEDDLIDSEADNHRQHHTQQSRPQSTRSSTYSKGSSKQSDDNEYVDANTFESGINRSNSHSSSVKNKQKNNKQSLLHILRSSPSNYSDNAINNNNNDNQSVSSITSSNKSKSMSKRSTKSNSNNNNNNNNNNTTTFVIKDDGSYAIS